MNPADQRINRSMYSLQWKETELETEVRKKMDGGGGACEVVGGRICSLASVHQGTKSKHVALTLNKHIPGDTCSDLLGRLFF